MNKAGSTTLHDSDSDNGHESGHVLPYEDFSSDDEPDPQDAFKGVALSLHGNNKFGKKQPVCEQAAETRMFNKIMKPDKRPLEFDDIDSKFLHQFNKNKAVIKENKNSNSDFLNN